MGLFGSLFGGGGETETSTQRRTNRRLIPLSYLTTVRILQGDETIGRAAGETQAVSTSSSGGSSSSFLFGLFGSSSQSSESMSDTGWKVSNTWLETKWDKARYALGIRDLGLFRFRYESTGVRISVPLRTHRDIRSLSLETEDYVPEEFLRIGGRSQWIAYFVSIDDGASWHPILPEGKPPEELNGKQIPQVYHLNSEVPVEERDPNIGYLDKDGEMKEFRVKVVMNRPSGVDFELMSPYYSRWTLKMAPR